MNKAAWWSCAMLLFAATAAPAEPGCAPIEFVYYPAVEVYHDPVTELWYWNDGRGWQWRPDLPQHYRQFTESGHRLQLNCGEAEVDHQTMQRRFGRGDPAKMSGNYDGRKFTVPLNYPRS